MSEPPYHIEIEGLGDPQDDAATSEFTGRPWLGIRFDCCSVYTRVYRNKEATAYIGACPHCGKPLRIRVGDSGTQERFFRAE